jgi:hypothetical protein
VRTLAAISCAALAASVWAQSDDVVRIQAGYQNLRAFPALQLRVDASHQMGDTNTSLGADIQWESSQTASGKPIYKFDAHDFLNGREILRTVADGTTLWALDRSRNEYRAHNYGAYAAQTPADYRLDLLQHYNSFSRTPANYAARLLREIYGDDTANYRTWAAGATVTVLTAGQPSKTDAISGRVYNPSPVMDYIIYELGSPVSRSVAFERTLTTMPDSTQQWVVSNVYLNETGKVKSEDRTLQVILTPTGLSSAPAPSAFQFAPPPGATPVEGSEVIR